MGWKLLLSLLLLAQGMPARQAEPLDIRHEGSTLLKVNEEEMVYPMSGVPIMLEERMEKLMNEVAHKVEIPPVNAALNSAGGIIPERTGIMLDKRTFQELIYGYVYEGDLTAIDVPTRVVYPRVDSEVLSAIKVRRIGHYSTYFNSRNQNRSHNIDLAASAVNNVVVFPGERFSFNAVVGKRTKEKGYRKAPVIVRGELYEDIGGGICQVSSTLFNAADRAGLTIVERYSHSRRVPYVPAGRDATVSWYGPDFVFENPYNQPILIRTFYGHGQVSIAICSSELVELQPRQVPSASRRLPEEVKVDEANARNIQ
ncbi:VanW family protein [Paenibacillus sp. J5C_2022]|uniref:VanW family protein n=1 Tax=Paenibacillus sp. J5C2022 TaxID=2977129 RepID=UPI0021D13728|nr:VanW family protein [Paenibacillus sp. J5C2022]MCU6709612.1 VanW family protein [Paenibacillus sp. J5C2022]